MRKKFILSIAATAAILFANPALNKADAASIYPTGEVKIIYSQNGNLNLDQINSLLKNYLTNLPISLDQLRFNQPAQQQAVPAENKVQQPAPTAAQAPTKAQAPTAAPAQQPAPQASSQVSAYEQKVVELTNQERAKHGLKPLALDTELSKVAREKSRDMQSKGYFSHTSPTYGSPFDMMKQFGITYRTAGENIAMGQRTPEEVVNAWMNSDGHRKNILSSSYTHIGVGHIAEGNYWTQMFIGK